MVKEAGSVAQRWSAYPVFHEGVTLGYDAQMDFHSKNTEVILEKGKY